MIDDDLAYLRERSQMVMARAMVDAMAELRLKLEIILSAACDESISGDDLREIIQSVLDQTLIDGCDPAPLADALEKAMGTAAAIGKTQKRQIYDTRRNGRKIDR